MEALFGHHHAGGCSRPGGQPGALSWDARPPCAVLAQALRDQGSLSGHKRVFADV